MRKVAKYAFNAPRAELPDGDSAWAKIRRLVDDWISSKGRQYEQDGAMRVEFRDGRHADLRTSEMSVGEGRGLSWTLEEPSATGIFRTTIHAAHDESVIAVACELEAGAPAQVVAPVFFDAHCPRVLREIIDLDAPWSVRDVHLSTKPRYFDGPAGGIRLAQLISKESRSLPLIVVSEYEGVVLHPGIAEQIARDLAGLAIVAQATGTATWELSRELGNDWSCYNGAIRLYWPLHAVDHTPYHHPLWTQRRLLFNVPGTREAAQRIRNQIRRKVLGLSTLTMRRHAVFDHVERAHRAHLVEQRRAQATTQEEMLELYEQENERLESENSELRNTVERLETDVANAKAMLTWGSRDSDDEVAPEVDVPPETVLDAVKKSRRQHRDYLVFGDDVSDGVGALAENAGPPDKLFNYFEGLTKLAEARRSGALGATMIKWLRNRGHDASGESDTIRNSDAEMQKRTWHDGKSRRRFEMHLKPNDGASPDRCARIYFDWDDRARKVVIGWVGRHP